MRQFRGILLSSLVWLTAVMTLIAGSPHIVCRCPNGNIKLFCLGPSVRTTRTDSKKAMCCCNGKCCGAAEAKECRCGGSGASDCRVAASCCASAHDRQPAGKDPKVEIGVRATCCAKTLVQPKLVSTSHQKTGIATDEALAQVLFLDAVQSSAPLGEKPSHAGLQAHQRPPPTDLIVVLLHLVI
jgi:hypothetical protein